MKNGTPCVNEMIVSHLQIKAVEKSLAFQRRQLPAIRDRQRSLSQVAAEQSAALQSVAARAASAVSACEQQLEHLKGQKHQLQSRHDEALKQQEDLARQLRELQADCQGQGDEQTESKQSKHPLRHVSEVRNVLLY